ncbi:MAG: hypothetical protein H7246_09370 [Phycisphaerae bacterium]|nr:hypothetical protein [Saprospiraceae bacterium]
MKKALILIWGFCFSNGFLVRSQETSYIQYHMEFSQVEELIVKEQYQEAEIKLDALFKVFKVKFAKDYVIAAQISLINGHKEKGLEFMRSAIRMGVKVKCLQSIALVNRSMSKLEWEDIKIEEKNLRKDYLKGIDLKLYEEFHARYQEEQNAKRTEQYKAIVYSNFNRIKDILEKGESIGSDVIGIDNQSLALSLSDCDLGNSRIIVTLLHYDYPISEIGIDNLISEMGKGNLHPRAFATIYNFEKNKVSVLYAKSKKKYKELPEYQFNFPFGDKSTDLEEVNSDRFKIGICKYEVELKMDEICRKNGMKLKFIY